MTTEYWPWPCVQRSVPWLYVSTEYTDLDPVTRGLYLYYVTIEYWPWPCDQRSVPWLYVSTEYTDLDHATRGLYLDYMWVQSILTLTMWPEACTLPICEYRVLTLTMWPEACTLPICEYRVLTLTMCPEVCTLIICEYRVYRPWPCDQRSLPWLYVSTEYWPWPCYQRSVPCLYVNTEYTDLDHVTRGLHLDYMWVQSTDLDHVSYDGKPGWPRREVGGLPGGDVQQDRHQSHQYPLYHLGENLQNCDTKFKQSKIAEFSLVCLLQGITKRCRLSLLTNRALVIRVPMLGYKGGCGVSANEYSCAHHVTWSPNKLWRSTSIFNLWSMTSLVSWIALLIFKLVANYLFTSVLFLLHTRIEFRGSNDFCQVKPVSLKTNSS